MNKAVISQCGHRDQFDIIVVGSGVAALSYVLELAELYPSISIALLTKTYLTQSNTYYAQGGIAAALADEDSVSLHVEDTLRVGNGLCNENAVEAILEQGKSAIQFLQRYGVIFDANQEGELNRAQEAGHTKRRVYHCGDKTGAAIVDALIPYLKSISSLTIFENHTAINLITNSKTQNIEVVGLYALDNVSGLIHTFLAKAIVLGTGGAGKVYRYTTNPDTATGDGIAMAYRAGAEVSHLEFYQFHPTLLYHTQKNNFLISEALRGEGAYLRLPDTQERFMQRYAPEKMELATRDIIAQAMVTEIERGSYDFIYLDIRHQSKAFLKQRFPVIYQTLLTLGLDLHKDLIPVVPAAHYLCGGIVADVNGKTSLGRLYAIGETAFTGLHGANRLASNSLLEGTVMGRNAAKLSEEWLSKPFPITHEIKDWVSTSIVDARRTLQINAHWRGLRTEMSAYAGIIRTQAGLQDLLKLVSLRRDIIEKHYWNYLITPDLIELRNIILIAELIAKSALKRHESCGNHYREDYVAQE